MTQAVQHAAHLSLPAFMYRYAVVERRGDFYLPDYCRMRHTVLKLNTLLQLAFLARLQITVYVNQILFLILKFGMSQSIG